MKLLRKHLRFIAAFLIVNTLYYTFGPTVAWALTAGPTAPEATSFEPVDTTDMVNLLTGDLVYNMPLLEVPGPSGGYPLSLSYHGGIMTNEESSWVGLGWTLNPGSITRNVNGFADDHMNAEVTDRFYWEGGERTVTRIGVSYAGVTAGISVGNDTYQGKGYGAFFSYGFSTFGDYGSNVGLNFSLGGGVDPWGNLETSMGVGVSLRSTESSSLQLTGGAGISYNNFESVSGNANASVNYKTGSSTNSKGRLVGNYRPGLGASISSSSGGINTSLSVGGGGFGINNSRSGNVSTKSGGFSLPIPYVHLSYNYTRYWIDETETQQTNGTLYYPDAPVTVKWLNDHAYDTYSLQTFESIIDNIEPDRVKGGTLPSYDDYSVNTQGISGSIKPHFYQKYLTKENFRNYNPATESYDNDIVHYSIGDVQNPVEFRFINDFSNRYQYQTSLSDFTSDDTTIDSALDYSFVDDSDLITGEDGSDGITDNHLAGSRHIEFITNRQIIENQQKKAVIGFIETKSTGFDRSGAPADQIGGFVITNETGVKYHFSLPAYAYDEYRYSENVFKDPGSTFNETKKNEPYAYTWFLTALTGPDYVDRGTAGPDESDWGYWIEFDYGKWTDRYGWRTQGEGMKQNKDYNHKGFSSGKKELYYLDAVKTKSHTALFVKDIKHDGKSALPFINSIDQWTKEKDDFEDRPDFPPESLEGGFIPKRLNCRCELRSQLAPIGDYDLFKLDYYARPVSTLKLDKIILLRNDALSAMNLDKLQGQELGQANNIQWVKHQNDLLGTSLYGCDDFTKDVDTADHLPENVLDIHDTDQFTIDNAQRVIRFNHDYSLSPQTSNSYDFKSLIKTAPSTDPADYELLGKLTLKSVRFLGKGGSEIIPPTSFGYDIEDPKSGIVRTSSTGDPRIFTFESSTADLGIGEILKMESDEKTYYAVISEVQEENYTIKVLGRNIPLSGLFYWQQTKNPPYDQEAYDNWNNYKSDYIDNDDENVDRITTKASSLSVDAWSLRSITSNLGSKIGIEYDSDSYSETVLYRNNSLRIKEFKDANVTTGRVRIEFSNNQIDLEEIYKPNDLIDIIVLYKENNVPPEGSQDYETTAETLPAGVNGYIYKNIVPIYSVNENTITIEASNFVNFFYDYSTDPLDDSLPPFSRTLIGGNLSLTNPIDNYGGGVRVKEITLNNQTKNTIRRTSYDYSLYGSDVISGVTSYEPVGLIKYDNYGYPDTDELIKVFRRELIRGFADVMLNAREAPAPGVMYSNVTVSESIEKNELIHQIPSQSTYEFEVFDEGKLGTIINNSSTLGSLGDVVVATEDVGGISIPTVAVNNNQITATDVIIKDYTTQVGNLKKVTLRNINGVKISETINHYLHDQVDMTGLYNGNMRFNALKDNYEPLVENQFNGQGILEETFVNARFARETSEGYEDLHKLIGVVTKRERFPSIQTGQTNINHKTGITTTSKNVAYDFYSGTVTRTVNTDGYGNHFYTEITPAYRVTDYESGMGLAINGGANMLTQTAATYTYKVGDPELLDKQALMSAEIQTWNDHWSYREFDTDEYLLTSSESDLNPVWRKKSSYIYKGDDQVLNSEGLYTYTDVNHPAFSSWLTIDPNENSQWEKVTEYTLYSRNSHALEAIDINGNYAATKMGFDHSKVLASTSNGRYSEFAYSGAEDDIVTPGSGFDYFGGEVRQSNGVRSSSIVHTGEYSIKTTGTERAFEFKSQDLIPGRGYRLSVWSSDLAGDLQYKINNGSTMTIDKSNARSSNGWNLITGIVTMPANVAEFEMWCQGSSGTTIYFDDFRFQPVDATTTAYVYDIQTDELTYILDNNNIYTKFNYDAMGRLTSTAIESFDHDEVKVSEVQYTHALNDVKFDINASAIGSGGVNPSTQKAITNGTAEILLEYDNCAYLIEDVEVDGRIVSGKNERIGGTDISYDSQKVYLNGIRGDHEVLITYLPSGNVASGTKVYFSCQQDTQGCPTGLREYKTANGCGGYMEAEGVYSYEESASCCDSVPTGCPACTVNDPNN